MKKETKKWVDAKGNDCQSVTWSSEIAPLYIVLAHVGAMYSLVWSVLGVVIICADGVKISSDALLSDKVIAYFINDPNKILGGEDNIEAASVISQLSDTDVKSVLTIVNQMWAELP